jgi:hypothetical protein
MEHLLIRLILWFDGSFQKPLTRVIPNLENLLADPRGTLAGGDIVIGPWRRYGIGLGLGLLLVVFAEMLLGVAKRNAGAPGPAGQVLGEVLPLLVIPVCLALGVYLVRGGHAVLTVEGVHFQYRGREVFCPWSLFHAPGVPLIHPVDGHNRFELPIAPAAVPRVELRRHGYAVAQGLQVKARHFRFRSVNEAVLKNIYRAREEEFAYLLQHLGRALGASSPDQAAVPGPEALDGIKVPPPAVLEDDGWITVRLTQVNFPPYCCECGARTEGMEGFRAYASFMHFGRLLRIDSGEHFVVYVPLCPECRRASNQRYWKTFRRTALWLPILGGLGATFLGLILAVADGNPQLLPGMPIGFGILGGLLCFLVGLPIGILRGRKASLLVELERYSPAQGTCAIRFRNREYASQMLQNMGVA